MILAVASVIEADRRWAASGHHGVEEFLQWMQVVADDGYAVGLSVAEAD